VQSVENARGIIDSLSNVFQKAKEGTKLTDTQREQLKSAIQTIVTAQDNKFYETVYDMKKDFNDR
jgi:predicted nucleic acid-binding OB-fold protein